MPAPTRQHARQIASLVGLRFAAHTAVAVLGRIKLEQTTAPLTAHLISARKFARSVSLNSFHFSGDLCSVSQPSRVTRLTRWGVVDLVWIARQHRPAFSASHSSASVLMSVPLVCDVASDAGRNCTGSGLFGVSTNSRVTEADSFTRHIRGFQNPMRVTVHAAASITSHPPPLPQSPHATSPPPPPIPSSRPLTTPSAASFAPRDGAWPAAPAPSLCSASCR